MQDDHLAKNGPQSLPLCDIVMDGGVTSGIIYPKVVAELSRQFRLKNIGGTSVGALAAAITAAAELGRLRSSDASGYARLAALPEELGRADIPGSAMTRLFNLFQPQRETRPLFDILAASLNRSGKLERARHMLLAAIRNYGLVFAAVALVVLPVQGLAGQGGAWNWIVACLFAAVCGSAAVAVALWKTATGPFVRNGFGMCTGYLRGAAERLVADEDRKRAPLTLWLSREINQSAAMGADGPPLTFGELWKPSGVDSEPPEWLRAAGITSWRYIDLQMIATNVTHRRPYRFPYLDDDQELFFDPEELQDWFPPNVIAHLVEHAQEYRPDPAEKKPPLPQRLRKLPPAEKLPLVFAARLSLSFPFLLSAVPLYAIDYESGDAAKRSFGRCWFSDGGICSNFPIHFFDSPVPLWPTFGIKLEAERKFHPIVDEGDEPGELSDSRFFLPNNNPAGRGDTMARFDEAAHGSARLFGFVGAMLDSARHWQDHMLARAPAVRDRVVRVYLKPDEGGLNLNMPSGVLKTLSSSGERTAAMLAERFRPGSLSDMNFDNHRWIRLRNLTRVIEADFSSIHKALAAQRNPSLVDACSLVDTLGARQDWGSQGADDAQRAKIKVLLAQLAQLSREAADGGDLLKNNAPYRTPALRIVPDI
jgi:predicted acylesterase/phospholipase RssA